MIVQPATKFADLVPTFSEQLDSTGATIHITGDVYGLLTFRTWRTKRDSTSKGRRPDTHLTIHEASGEKGDAFANENGIPMAQWTTMLWNYSGWLRTSRLG